jgi:drug/metabolite transporter (DMT)-like permease
MTTTPIPASSATATMPASRDWRAIAAACTSVVLWASAFVSIRSAGDAYSPGALALGRLLAGSLMLGAILLVRREGLPSRGAWPGILVNIGPILIALLGARLLGEGLPRRLVMGMAVSFAGAVVVGLSMSGQGGSSVLGVALCLVAAVAYAAGVVTQKPALRHGSALQITTYSCLIGTAACLPFSGVLVSEAADAPLSATLNMVYLGIFPTALAFTTWAYALARTTAGKMGATTYAVPALVVLMSWLLLDEVPALLTVGGGLLCLAGVAVSRMRPQTGRTQKSPAQPVEGRRDDAERQETDRPREEAEEAVGRG